VSAVVPVVVGVPAVVGFLAVASITVVVNILNTGGSFSSMLLDRGEIF